MRNQIFALGVVAASVSSLVSGVSVSAAGYDSALNQASYWGTNCVKTDMNGNVMTYTATGSNVIKVVVKGGTENAVYTNGNYTNLTAPINPRNGKPYGISHVIVCYGTSTSTPVVEGDNNGKVDTDDRDNSHTTVPTKPHVLGTSTTGARQGTPAEIPATGSHGVSLALLFSAVVATGTTYFAALRRQA